MESLAIHSINVIVVQVQPNQLTQACELVRSEVHQAVVTQGETLCAYRHITWHITEGIRFAVYYFPITSTALGAGTLSDAGWSSKQPGRHHHCEHKPSEKHGKSHIFTVSTPPLV